MTRASKLLTALFWIALSGEGMSQTVVVLSDVSVTFTAVPTSGLVVGQPIDFTLTVTNIGPNQINDLLVESSNFVFEFGAFSQVTGDCFLLTRVSDTTTGFFYNLDWFVTGSSTGSKPLAVGQTVTCHFRTSLSSSAPTTTLFSFGLPSYYTDVNPANSRATVTLQEVLPVVPTISRLAEMLLGALLLAVGSSIVRRDERMPRLGGPRRKRGVMWRN